MNISTGSLPIALMLLMTSYVGRMPLSQLETAGGCYVATHPCPEWDSQLLVP